MQVLRVGLEIYVPVGFQELAVIPQEQRCREAFLDPVFAQLRVGEGDPYLVDLVLGEERIDKLYARAQESDICQAGFGCGLGAAPHSGPLDVDADEVAAGVACTQCDGILSAAAAEFQNYRVVVPEEPVAPMPLERVVAVEDLLETRLNHILESQILGESSEFVLSHCICEVSFRG